MIEEADHAEVLEAGQVLVDRGELARESDDASDLAGLLHDVEAVHRGAARRGCEDRREDADHRRLARTVGSEESEDLPGRHLQRDAVEGTETRRR